MDFGLDKFGAQIDKLGEDPARVPHGAPAGGRGARRRGATPTSATCRRRAELEKLRAGSSSSSSAASTRCARSRRTSRSSRRRSWPSSASSRSRSASSRTARSCPVLLTDINTLGKTSGLEIKAFRPSPRCKRDFYAEVPIEVEFVGKFHDIVALLRSGVAAASYREREQARRADRRGEHASRRFSRWRARR